MTKPKLVLQAEEAHKRKALHKAENKERFGVTKDVARKRLRAYRDASSYEELDVGEEMPAEVWGAAKQIAGSLGLPSNTVVKAIKKSDSPAAFWDELGYRLEDKEFDEGMEETTQMDRLTKQVVGAALEWLRSDGTEEEGSSA